MATDTAQDEVVIYYAIWATMCAAVPDRDRRAAHLVVQLHPHPGRD